MCIRDRAVTVTNLPTLNSSIRFREAGLSAYGSIDGMSLGDTWFLSLKTNYGGRMARILLDQGITKEAIHLETTDGNSRIRIDSDSGISIVGKTLLNDDIRIGGGLTVGDTTLDPLAGVLLMKERTTATAATPADAAQIWVQDVAGTQKLYVKFANGVQREIATA